MLRHSTLLFLIIASLLVLAPGSPATAAESGGCDYTLGFKTLHDLIPDQVGPCRANEHHNVLSGDGLQETAGVDGKGGLLVWRKADNWTAYTDGYRTWINGPNGLQQRLNSERFPWEKDAAHPEQSPAIEWTLHRDGERSFKYPTGWVHEIRRFEYLDHYYFYSPDRKAYFSYIGSVRTGYTYKPEDFLTMLMKAWNGRHDFVWGRLERTTISGKTAALQWYEFPRGDDFGEWPSAKGVAAALQSDDCTYFIDGRTDAAHWAEYEPILLEGILSLKPN